MASPLEPRDLLTWQVTQIGDRADGLIAVMRGERYLQGVSTVVALSEFTRAARQPATALNRRALLNALCDYRRCSEEQAVGIVTAYLEALQET